MVAWVWSPESVPDSVKGLAVPVTATGTSVLGAPARFPLPFVSPTMNFASVPCDGTALHPHIHLSTVPPEPRDEGVDVPDANVAIVVSGNSTAREHIQRLGRVIRPKQTEAVLYELVTRYTSEVHGEIGLFTIAANSKMPVKFIT